MTKPVSRTAARYALLASMSLAFTPAALAADPTAAPGAATQSATVALSKIMVTGTAIPRTSIETPAPVTVFTAEQIKQTGLTTLADVVRTISADNSGTIPTAFTLGFAAGSSGLALRGLTVTAAILNFFDRKAPLDQIDYAGVNYNPTYDQSGAIGRFFTLGLRATF